MLRFRDLDVDGVLNQEYCPRMNAPSRISDQIQNNIIGLFGRWRRFGMDGPVYEIIEDRARPSDRGPVVRVRAVLTGEELDYRLESLMGDPQER